MEQKLHKIGWGVLAVGIVLMLTGIILAFTVGTLMVPIFISSSILVNTIAITMLRYRKP